MSEVSSHSKVHSVSCAQVVASAGAVLIGSIVAAALEALSESGQREYSRPSRRQSPSSQKGANHVDALPTLEPRRVQIENKTLQQLQRRNLPPLEASKISTLKSLQATPYVVRETQIRQPLQDLVVASSISGVDKARKALLDAVNNGHRQTLQQTLTVACSNAAMKVGFSHVEVAEGSLGCVRVIAMSPEGKTLVTELDAGDADRAPRIETEVVGTCDDSCVTILDAFDRALEEEGVRSDPPDRRHTGGVCELAAAREFVRKIVSRVPTSGSQATAAHTTQPRMQDAVRRAQRLNSQGVQKQR